MQNTTSTWKEIVANGEYNLQTVALVYGATGTDPNGTAGSDSIGAYKEYATITAPVITRALLSGDAVSVGNTIAGSLSFTLMTTDTIPKSARIKIKTRPTDGTNYGEWIEQGTFWIDHRTVTDDLIDIEAYDAMKMGNQAYADDSQSLNWPKTISTVVNRIAVQMGVSIDSRTIDNTLDNPYVGGLNIVLKPDDNETLLDVLKHIGEVIGGNWTITPENKLRFVEIVYPPNVTNYIIDEAHNRITTRQNDYLIWKGTSQSHTEQIHPYGGSFSYVPVVLGNLTTASRYTISKVTLAMDSEHVYTVGDDTGYNLIASTNNPYASAALADLLYVRVGGFAYVPFESTNSVYDPATELGDWFIVGDVYSVLYNETRRLDIGFTADATAPGRDEIEDEYPYRTFEQKTQYQLDKANSEIGTLHSEIQQLPSSILLTVSETYETKSDSNSKYSALNVSLGEISAAVSTKVGNNEVRSKFALDPTNITLNAGVDSQGHATGVVTFNSGTFVVNSTNFQVTSTGIMSCNGANISGNFGVTYDPDPDVPHEYGDMSFAIKIDGNGLRFLSNNRETAVIHEFVENELVNDVVQVVDKGICLESNGSLPIWIKGRLATIDSNAEYYGATNSVTVDGRTLNFVNGLFTGYT